MTGFLLTAMLIAGTGVAQQPPKAPSVSGDQLAQVTIRERVIIRVQTLTQRKPAVPRKAPSKPLRWKEHKAKKCVAVNTLATATVTQASSVDLTLVNGSRLRAKLDSSCPSLDFYSGIYFKPNRDGNICADRDIIFSRSGSECEINSFKKLVAEP